MSPVTDPSQLKETAFQRIALVAGVSARTVRRRYRDQDQARTLRVQADAIDQAATKLGLPLPPRRAEDLRPRVKIEIEVAQ
ncbi:MAG TPA: hypothetical protein VHM70_12045 [Polyangiaceae bacterium]|nr:hypothetical protein [Polyangiaceae bacterium]